MVNRKGKRLVAYLLAFSMVLTVAGIQLAAQGQETEYITTWEEGFNVDDSGAWVTEHTFTNKSMAIVKAETPAAMEGNGYVKMVTNSGASLETTGSGWGRIMTYYFYDNLETSAAGGALGGFGELWAGITANKNYYGVHVYLAAVKGPVVSPVARATGWHQITIDYSYENNVVVSIRKNVDTNPDAEAEVMYDSRTTADTKDKFSRPTKISLANNGWCSGTTGQVLYLDGMKILDVKMLEDDAVSVAVDGPVMTANIEDIEGISYRYQWQKENPDTHEFEDVAGATEATYTAPIEDVGRTFRVAVIPVQEGRIGAAVTATAVPEQGEIVETLEYVTTWEEGFNVDDSGTWVTDNVIDTKTMPVVKAETPAAMEGNGYAKFQTGVGQTLQRVQSGLGRIMSFYFYDDLENSANVGGLCGYGDVFMGVLTGDKTHYGTYVYPKANKNVTSNVERSTGWHKVEVDYSYEADVVVTIWKNIDTNTTPEANILYDSRNDAEVAGKFTRPSKILATTNGWANGTKYEVFYIDDIKISDIKLLNENAVSVSVDGLVMTANVEQTGAIDYRYQWQKEKEDKSGYENIADATDASYTAEAAGNYRVEVTPVKDGRIGAAVYENAKTTDEVVASEYEMAVFEGFNLNESDQWENVHGYTASKGSINVQKASGAPAASEGNGYLAVNAGAAGWAEKTADYIGEAGNIWTFDYYDSAPESKAEAEVMLGNLVLGTQAATDVYYGVRGPNNSTWYKTSGVRSQGWHRFEADYSYANNVVITFYRNCEGEGEVLYDSRTDANYKDKITKPTKVGFGNGWVSTAGSTVVNYIDNIQAGYVKMIDANAVSISESDGTLRAQIQKEADITYTLQWQGKTDAGFGNISGATEETYTIPEGATYTAYRLQVSASRLVDGYDRTGNIVYSNEVEVDNAVQYEYDMHLFEGFNVDETGKWENTHGFSASKGSISIKKAGDNPAAVEGNGYLEVRAGAAGWAEKTADYIGESGNIWSFWYYDSAPETRAETVVMSGGLVIGTQGPTNLYYGVRGPNNTTWYLTKEPRSEGWHRFEADYSYGDNVVVKFYRNGTGAGEVLYDSRTDAAFKGKVVNPTKLGFGNGWASTAGSPVVNYIDNICVGYVKLIDESDVTVTRDGVNLKAVVSGNSQCTYIWQSSAEKDGTYTDIPGATEANYTIPMAEVDKFYRVKVSATLQEAEWVREGNTVYSEGVQATELLDTLATVANHKIEVTANADGSLTYTASANYVPAKVNGVPEGSVEYTWYIGESEDGEFTQVEAIGTTYTMPAAQNKWYVKVIATPKTSTGISGIPSVQVYRLDPYEKMRKAYRNYLIGSGYDTGDPIVRSKISSLDSSVDNILKTYLDNPTKNQLFDDMILTRDTTGGINLYDGFGRLRQMAQAYATEGSKYYHDEELLEKIIAGCDYYITSKETTDGIEWYSPDTYSLYYTNGKLKPPVGINWWQLEIGVPQHLEELCIYIYEDLPKEKLEVYMEAVDMFANSPTHASGGTASANGMWMASNVALRAILLSNPPLTDAQKADERYQSPSIKNLDKLSAAKLKIESLINFVSGGEVNGFHTDGSHIDHSYYSSNGGYGISFANYVTKAVSLFANSDYSIDQSKMDIVMAWVRNSYETVVYRTNLMDMTRGRDVGRYGSPSQKIGFSYYTLLVSMVDILEDPEDLAFVKRHIKYYTQEFARAYGSIESVYSGLSIPYIAVVQSIMDDDTIEAEKDYVTHKQFPTISKVTHYRPDFGLGVSMYGNKTLNYEDGGEFKNGWNSSNGMLYIYTDDTYQFDGNYWPTVDANRLPGATAIYGAWGLGQGSSNANQATYVGGTALGDYGTAGMILQPTGLTLSAKKSYFMFDNEVVALGSDISATGDKMVETTLENRKLKEDLSNQFFVDGAQVENGTKENAKWAYLEGNTEKSGIGYYFPEGETVKFKRETNSGRWSDINSILSSSELHTNSFQQLYIEHGKTVTDGDYAYIILPASDKEKTQAYAEAPNITILEKSKNIHAVKHNQLGMIAANVFVDGPADIGGMITIDKASSIMTQETADTFAISVSDPTQNSNAKATVTVNVAVDATPISSDSRISNISVEGNKLTFTVNFAQSAGQGAVLVMKKTADASIEAESDFCGYEEGIIDFGGWTVNNNGMNIDTNTVKEGAQSLMLSGTGAVTYTQQDAKKNITFYFYPETGNSASVRAEDGNGAYIELGNKNGRYYIATDERTLENDVPIVENQWNKITIDSTSGEFTKMMVETSVTAIHYGMNSVSKLIFGSEGDGGKAYIDNVNVRTFKPSVSNVSLTQTERVFAADYLFTDYSGANEGNSIIAWSVSGDGETFETIPGATGKTLEITDEQVEHWFKVSVTPVNAAGVTGETVTSAAVQETKLSSPKIRNLSMVSAAGADGLTTHTVTYEYVAPELGSAAGEAEGETSVVWYIGDSADGPFTQIADAEEYTVTKEQIKKYLKVVIVPKTINGVSGGEYSVVKQDTTSLAPIFNEADTEKKMKAVIDQYAGVLGYGDRLAALPEVDVELFVKLMMKQYASDDEITSALEYAYTTSAQGDPIIYKVLETAGFESGSWTVDSGKTALKEKENPLAREGNRLAETSGSTTDTGVYKFENMGRYKYIMYFYDSGGAGAVALMEITCGNTTLMLTFRPDQSKGYYTTRVKQGDPFVSTGIMRSEGWHRVEWDYSDEKNLTILLDGAVAYDSKNTSEKDTYIGNPSQIRVGNIWGSGVGGSDSSLTWFDALSVLEYNVVPTIKDVSITQNKERLTANGSFEDVSGAKEGNHDYQWYVADMENGEYTKISGATSRTLNLTKDDVAKYFKVEITPKNADGRQGVPVMSGVYQENYLQTLAPSVTNVRVSGTPTQNNTVSAEYTYQQGTSGLPEYEEKARYSWYVSDTENGTYVKIAGADKKEYTFTVADAMKYFKVGVSVVEKEGETEEGRVSPIVFSAPVRNTSDVLWVVRNADATQLKELFPSYVDGLGLSSKFAGLSETTILNIYRGIAKKSYASESDLKKAIDEIISGISTKPGTGGSSGGGTGGGSGGGTGGAGGGNSSNDSSLFIEPQPSVPVKEKFTDLGTAEWAREAIEYLSEKEYVKGKAAGLFAPDDNVTRAEFVTILMRSMELSLEDPTGAFDDVAVTDWFYPYVAKAAGLGLVKGKDEKHFCPDDFITREEMAVLVYRFAVYTERQFETGETAAFADAAHIADYAKEAVEVLSANGVINGIGGGYFDPQGVSTRAMAAQMVYRIIIK